MRVLVINRYFYPDHAPTSVLLSDLAFALSQREFQVTAVTSRLRYDGGGFASSRETVRGVAVYRVWSSSWGRSNLLGRTLDYLSFYISSAWRLWCLAPDADVIVAKTDPPLLSVMVAVVARIRGKTLVNWLQDIFPEVAEALNVGGGVGRLTWKLVRPLRNWSFRSARMNVVVGELMAAHLRNLGIPTDQICVIPNWADGALIKPIPPSQNELRHRWGLQDKTVVGYAGNLGRAHDIDTLTATIELLNRRASDAPQDEAARKVVFIFVGGGVHHAKLNTKIARKQLSNVQMYPYQPQETLSEVLGLADIHIVSLNPKMEGLIVPSKFYGIAAAGRPTIFIGASDGEIGRLVEREHCGFTVSSGDAESLASRILELIKDPALRRRLGGRARKAFEERWDREHALDQWLEVLNTAAQRTAQDHQAS